jgi:hypothetical protein
MAIDVGGVCEGKNNDIPSEYTVVSQKNPANATGTIDYFCCFTHNQVNEDSLQIASFDDEGSNTLSTNGTAAVTGTLPADTNCEFNAPGNFTAFNIDSGEYIGMVGANGGFEVETGTGENAWYVANVDHIPCSSQGFSVGSGWDVAIYATGTEAGGGAVKELLVGAGGMGGGSLGGGLNPMYG